jgi:hypothetical protein
MNHPPQVIDQALDIISSHLASYHVLHGMLKTASFSYDHVHLICMEESSTEDLQLIDCFE